MQKKEHPIDPTKRSSLEGENLKSGSFAASKKTASLWYVEDRVTMRKLLGKNGRKEVQGGGGDSQELGKKSGEGPAVSYWHRR